MTSLDRIPIVDLVRQFVQAGMRLDDFAGVGCYLSAFDVAEAAGLALRCNDRHVKLPDGNVGDVLSEGEGLVMVMTNWDVRVYQKEALTSLMDG